MEIENSGISTRENLARRRLFVVGSDCPVCGFSTKPVSHSLLSVSVLFLLFGGHFGKSSNVLCSKGAYVQILCWLLKEHNTVAKNI